MVLFQREIIIIYMIGVFYFNGRNVCTYINDTTFNEITVIILRSFGNFLGWKCRKFISNLSDFYFSIYKLYQLCNTYRTGKDLISCRLIMYIPLRQNVNLVLISSFRRIENLKSFCIFRTSIWHKNLVIDLKVNLPATRISK